MDVLDLSLSFLSTAFMASSTLRYNRCGRSAGLRGRSCVMLVVVADMLPTAEPTCLGIVIMRASGGSVQALAVLAYT